MGDSDIIGADEEAIAVSAGVLSELDEEPHAASTSGRLISAAARPVRRASCDLFIGIS